MQVYDAKNVRYRDGLAEKRRKVFVLKSLFFSGLAVAVTGLVFYLLFFSKTLDIKEISINGLDKVNKENFNRKLNERIASRWLGYIEHQKNILFFNSDDFTAEALAGFPEIKSISVKKDLLHALNIDVEERKTAGVWCFINDCKYFDEEGNVWGEAARSAGFLLLNVDDLRQKDSAGGPEEIDRKLLADIMLISKRLKESDIYTNRFIIQDNFIGDFSVLTSGGYKLMFSTDSNIEEQLKVLEIFLREKQEEFRATGGFSPQYIDLRIDGRLYFK